MSKIAIKLVCLAGMFSLLICSYSAYASNEYGCYLEAAPLKGIMGQPSFRVEGVFGRTSVGINFERTTAESEQDKFVDTTSKFGADALWYPLVGQERGFFLGAGLQFERELVGRESERDYVTWVKADADEMQDRWVEENNYLLATQTIGYRFFFAELATASIRVTLDEVAGSWGSTIDEDLKSRDPDLSIDKRSGTRTQFLMHAGITLR